MPGAGSQRRERGRQPKAGSAADFLMLSRALSPAILGLGIAQAALVAAVYGGASYSHDPFIPNLSTIVAAPFAIALIVALSFSQKLRAPRFADALGFCGIGLQVVCALGLAAIAFAGLHPDLGELALSALAVLGNALAVTYWLHLLKSFPRRMAALAAFTAVAFCEALSLGLAFIPYGIACAVAGVLSVLQIPLALVGGRRLERLPEAAPAAADDGDRMARNDYLELLEARSNDARFLILSVVAAAVVSMAVGMLWSFPTVSVNEVGPGGRAACAVFAVVVALLVARKLGHPSGSDSPAGTWVAMEVLGIAALLLYTLVPGLPVLGMMCLFALNAVASAFIWCIAVALMNRGRLNPYCYGLGGLMAFLLPGAVVRMAMAAAVGAASGAAGAVAPHFPGDAFVAGFLGMLTLLPVQIIMIASSKARLSDKEQMGRLLEGLTRAMGLDGDEARPVDVRRAFMEDAAADMQRTFKLSDREAEILSLYALGMTQGRIAEELHVSPSTVHTHIVHIYTKTGLHSRQALMDYMDSRYSPASKG